MSPSGCTARHSVRPRIIEGVCWAIVSIFASLILDSQQAAWATPTSIAAVQAQIDFLRTEAAGTAEMANEAQVKVDRVQQKLRGTQRDQAVQGKSLARLRQNLGRLAATAYKTAGMGQGLQLLFSKDPTQYLASANLLEVITRGESTQIRRFTGAAQRLRQTSLLVSDQAKQAKAAQLSLATLAASAQSKLAKAEKLLSSLKTADRKRFIAAQAAQDARERGKSLKSVKLGASVSGRAGIAIKFALSQVGDRYVFGGAGPTVWDCSGLTLVAFRKAGVSLPHSAAAQSGYGRRVSRSELQPGDLVFFYPPQIRHVAIYLGKGLIVDAPRPGRLVRVVGLSTMPFAGAVRL